MASSVLSGQPRPLAGAVLAGGRSQRMGRDKATLRYAEETLLQRQIRNLHEAGVSEVLVGLNRERPGLASTLENARPIWDPTHPAEAGPILGLATALAEAHADLVAVVAVDLPALSPRWWRHLRSLTTPGRGAVGRHADGGFEPLAAIYPKGAAREVVARLRESHFALQPLIRAGLRQGWLRAWTIPTAWSAQLANWNHPGDVPQSGRNPG